MDEASKGRLERNDGVLRHNSDRHRRIHRRYCQQRNMRQLADRAVFGAVLCRSLVIATGGMFTTFIAITLGDDVQRRGQNEPHDEQA